MLNLVRLGVSCFFTLAAATIGGGCMVAPMPRMMAQGYWPGGGVPVPAYYAPNGIVARGGYLPAVVAGSQPMPGMPSPQGVTPGAVSGYGNQQAMQIAGTQTGIPTVVGFNPYDPYNQAGRVPPPPGMVDVQTHCPDRMPYYVPSTRTCSPTPWIPGVYTVRTPTNGVVTIPIDQLGPGGGVQGIPGVNVPAQQQPFVGGQPGFQPGFQQPFAGGYQPAW